MHEAAQGFLARKGLKFRGIESGLFRQLLECRFEEFEIQPVLALEMVVDGGLVDARLGHDVANARGLVALVSQELNSRLHDRTAGVFRRTRHCEPNSNKCLNWLHNGCCNKMQTSLIARPEASVMVPPQTAV